MSRIARIARINPRRALAAGAVAALATVGVSGALWTDQVTATGSVDTGNLTVKVEGLRAYENARTPSSSDPYADCTVTTAADGKSFTVNVEDAYPGMWCRTWFAIKNEGTVGAKVSGFAESGSLVGVMADMKPGYGLVGTRIEPGKRIEKAFDINLPSTLTESQLNEDGSYTYTQTFDFENVTLG